MNDKLCDNYVYIAGRMKTEAEYSHTVYGEGFYTFFMEIERLSGKTDIVPVTVSERILGFSPVYKDEFFAVEGQLRSYNRKIEGDKTRLMITVFVKNIYHAEEIDTMRNTNEIKIEGFICKPPVYRVTPLGREITDILVAVNRAFGKSDYIPCIAWGRNAKYAGEYITGDKVLINGRLQSRIYEKHLEDGTTEERTAYEVSVCAIGEI